MDHDMQEIDKGWVIKNPWHAAIYKEAEPFLQTRLNTLHTRIAYYFALKLLWAVGGEPDVVIPAILLHDVGWSLIPEDQQRGAFGPEIKKPDLQRRHEEEGARLATAILKRLGFSDDYLREIQTIVSGHDSRREALNLNDSVVKDADKLWRYTQEGFSIDHKRFGKTPRENLAWLIASIPEWFFHEESKNLAWWEALKRRDEYGIELEAQCGLADRQGVRYFKRAADQTGGVRLRLLEDG